MSYTKVNVWHVICIFFPLNSKSLPMFMFSFPIMLYGHQAAAKVEHGGVKSNLLQFSPVSSKPKPSLELLFKG